MSETTQADSPGIGTLSEKSLHAALKQWIAQPGDQFEVRTGRFVIDIMRGDTLIEIQTRHLYAMKRKLKRLLPEHIIHLYHPIARQKWIVRQTADGEPISRRKSPKKGQLHDVFNELVRIPSLLLEPNLTLHVLLTEEETILRDDGKGSWRRRGWSNHDRLLLGVSSEAVLAQPTDYLALLPADLPAAFSNRNLADALRCRPRVAGRITYTLRAMGLLKLAGKQGRANLFEVTS